MHKLMFIHLLWPHLHPGLIQSVYQLADGSGLVLTVGKYLTPDGTDIDRWGVGNEECTGSYWCIFTFSCRFRCICTRTLIRGVWQVDPGCRFIHRKHTCHYRTFWLVTPIHNFIRGATMRYI
jgi:hypothetical protein